jgi:transcriptional regulator with XRE-family HTH domain
VAGRTDKANVTGKPTDEEGPTRPSHVDSRVGDRLKLRRKILGLTLAELGERCALSAQQVHKYEQGLSSMSAARLAQVADVLSVPVGWFFDEGDTDRGLPSELLNFLADPQNMKVISLLIEINDPSTKRLVVRLVQDVADYASGHVLEPDDFSHRRDHVIDVK